MSKFMVIGNHRSYPEYYGMFSSQSEAIERVNWARNINRDKGSPLEWSLVTDNDNQFGMRVYLTAWDGSCTTNWIVVEIHEPRKSLDDMFDEGVQLHIKQSEETGFVYKDPAGGITRTTNPIPVSATKSQAAWDAYFKGLEREED